MYDNYEIEKGYPINIEYIEKTETNTNGFNQSNEMKWDDNDIVRVVIKNMFTLKEVCFYTFFILID